MSVEVATFAPVAELLAVTVAPGMSELPDFTTPEMDKECAEGASCASELAVSSSRTAIRCKATSQDRRNYAASACSTVIASPATVVRRMSRGWVSSKRRTRCIV